MKKFVCIVLCVILAVNLLLLAGCSSKENVDTTQKNTVVDMSGTTVEIPSKVDKYCVLYSSVLSICGILDENLEHLCMCPTVYGDWMSMLFPNIEEHVTVVNKKTVTAEQIIESGAQVVFCSSSTNQELIDSLKETGISCVNVGMKTGDDILKSFDIVATTLGTSFAKEKASSYSEKFEYYQNYVEQCVQAIPQSEKKSILVLGDLTDITGYGKNSYEAYWTNCCGLDYILPSDDGADKVNLTMEQVFEFDPDIILTESYIHDSISDSNWSSLHAYSDGNLLPTPICLDTWAKPGAESILICLWALNTFYPEYNGELNLENEVINFYNDFYGYSMSDENLYNVINGVYVEGD